MVFDRRHVHEIQNVLWSYRQAIEQGLADPSDDAARDAILDLLEVNRATERKRADDGIAAATEIARERPSGPR